MPITREKKANVDEAAAAMGVGIPEVEPKPHDPDVVTVHEVHPATRQEMRDGSRGRYFRWVEDDDRGYYGDKLDKGFRPVKAEEAKAAGIRGGHPRADGFLHRGQNGILMVCDRATRSERKRRDEEKRRAATRRMADRAKAEMREVPSNMIVGDVKTSEVG